MLVKDRKHNGFLLVEMVTALTALGVLLLCLALTMDGFRRLNNYHLVKQQCISAAQAELDSISVSGEAIAKNDFERLWPHLSISIEESDASGQWDGLKLVKVKAQGKSFNRDVKIGLCRYMEKRR